MHLQPIGKICPEQTSTVKVTTLVFFLRSILALIFPLRGLHFVNVDLRVIQVITVLYFIARYLFVLSNCQIDRSERTIGSFMPCVKSLF